MGLHPIFKECCAKEDARYSLKNSFLKDGFIYATNGHICVRMPSDGSVDEIKNSPPCGKLSWRHAGITYPILMPEMVSCEKCEGLKCFAKCTSCDGEGNCECQCGDGHDCCWCSGSGGFPDSDGPPCGACDGRGLEPKEDGAAVGCVFLGNAYIAILLRHGISSVVIGDDPKEPAYFTGENGIEGLIMPRTGI